MVPSNKDRALSSDFPRLPCPRAVEFGLSSEYAAVATRWPFFHGRCVHVRTLQEQPLSACHLPGRNGDIVYYAGIKLVELSPAGLLSFLLGLYRQ